LAIGALLLVHAILPGPDRTFITSELTDAAHVPLFAALAILAFSVLSSLRWPLRAGVAFTVVTLIAVLTEVSQIGTARDADPEDVMRGVVGGAAALVLLLVWRGHLRRGRGVLLAGALLAVGLYQVAFTAHAYRGRDRAFPRLCDFETQWERRFVYGQDASLALRPRPESWSGPSSDDTAGHVTFSTGAEYPALVFEEPFPDWTGYETLQFEVYSEHDTPVTLVTRVHDTHHDHVYGDRLNRNITIVPGANHITISLREIEDAPQSRPMDLARIRNLSVFADNPRAPFSLWFDAFRLEK
jgi:hypothetical protein